MSLDGYSPEREEEVRSILRCIDPCIDYSRCKMDGQEHSYYITIRQDGDDFGPTMIDMDLVQTHFLDAIRYVDCHVGVPEGWHITLYQE